MPEISLKLENIDRMIAAFKAAPGIVGQQMGEAVIKTAQKIEADAKRNAPVNKGVGGGKLGYGGNLRQSIYSRRLSLTAAEVGATAKYAAAVNDGSRPHVIRAKNAKVLTNGSKFFGRVVNHPGAKAQPFFTNAVDKNESWINDKLNEIADNIFTKMFNQ